MMTDQQTVAKSPDRPATLVRSVLLLLAGGFTANLIFNSAMAWLGFGYPYTLFLFRPDDRWADFFKLAFSYPDGAIHGAALHWTTQPLLDLLREQADYYRGSQINPDHLPPLPTLLALLVRRAMAVMDPMLVFIGCLGMAGMASVRTMATLSKGLPDAGRWTLALLFSYPFWFMLDRGHFFSLICALTLMTASWRMIASGRMDWRSILLVAIACNIRPNVILVPVLLVLSGRSGRIRDLVLLGFAGAVMLAVTMVAAHALYPHYGPASWIAGLAEYKALYIARPLSAGFTSSLPSAIALLFGYHPLILSLGLALGGIMGLGIVMAGRAGRLTSADLMFLALSLTPIATPAFNDYHLLPFILPLLLIARADGIQGRSDWITAIACIALLIPKNYIYGSADPEDPWSWQVVVNPLILLGASAYILARASLDRHPAPLPTIALPAIQL